jgi:DNA-binding NtrC family response regulator
MIVLNILLIDDDADCLECLSTALEPAGHRCDKFTVPEEAVEAYYQNQYNVVITDIKMPGLNGIEVLKMVRSFDLEAKVIIITAYGDAETVVAAVNNGAYAFFGKPLDFAELIGTLEKIEREHRERENARRENACLITEYARLKKAYEELQTLLKDLADK